jgi:hypothetical protein
MGVSAPKRTSTMLSLFEACSLSSRGGVEHAIPPMTDDPLNLNLESPPSDILLGGASVVEDLEPLVLLTRVPVRTRALFRLVVSILGAADSCALQQKVGARHSSKPLRTEAQRAPGVPIGWRWGVLALDLLFVRRHPLVTHETTFQVRCGRSAASRGNGRLSFWSSRAVSRPSAAECGPCAALGRCQSSSSVSRLSREIGHFRNHALIFGSGCR